MWAGEPLLVEMDYRERGQTYDKCFAVGGDMTYLVFERRQTGLVFSSDLFVYLKINMGQEWWYTLLISVLGR